MSNSPMYYEATPDGLKQAWKVQWVVPLGGYSETVHGTIHKVVLTAEEATQMANGLRAMNEILQNDWRVKFMDSEKREPTAEEVRTHFTPKYKHVCVERVFVASE